MKLMESSFDDETPSPSIKPESKKDIERTQAKAARDVQRQARQAKQAAKKAEKLDRTSLEKNAEAKDALVVAIDKAKEADEKAKAVKIEIQRLQSERETLESEKEVIAAKLNKELGKKRKENLNQQFEKVSEKIAFVDLQITEVEARATALASEIAAVASDAVARADGRAVSLAADSDVGLGVLGPIVGLAAAGILFRSARMSSLKSREAKQMRELQVELKIPGQESENVTVEKDNLFQQVKNFGPAGIISYVLWEWAFWTSGGALGLVAYYFTFGHWPDLSNADDAAKVGAEAFAFVNVARFAVPLRIGLAIGTAPWVDENIVRRFGFGQNESMPMDQKSMTRRSKEVREMVKAAQVAGQKSMPRIVLDGLGNLVKDPMGWYAGKGLSPLYSNLPSPEDIAREDYLITMAALNADLPKILRQDVPQTADTLAQDFKILSQEGEPLEGLEKLRRLAAGNDVQLHFNFVQQATQSKRLPESLVAHWNASFGIVKLPYWEVDWSKDTASWKDVPVDIDATAEFHLNSDKLVDYVRMGKWLVNGQEFRMWPEPATRGLLADLPEVIVREPNWSNFAPDFTAYDQTGLTGNWILPYNTNQALLQVMRNLHSQLSASFKIEYQTEIERTIVSVFDGTLEPALICQWTYNIASDENSELPEGLKAVLGFLPVFDGSSATTVAGSLVFRFNAEGKVSSMKIGPLSANGRELRFPSLNILDLFSNALTT